MLRQGIGFFAVDSPGTGQAPMKAGETSERMYSRVLDYLATRQDIDSSRILVHGQSFGANWAAKLAHTEAKRLVGAVAQSPPIHRTFQTDFFRSRMYTREYLFDLLPASLYDASGEEIGRATLRFDLRADLGRWLKSFRVHLGA